MRKANRLMGLALVAAASTSADTQQTNVRTDAAYFSYSRDDHAVGGKQVTLNVNVAPVWPLTDLEKITYSGQECTIDSCYEMFPGYEWCYCSFWSMVQFSGSGQLPKGAFSVSPQGMALLALDATLLTGGDPQGPCDRLDVTWTPNGQWHEQQDGKIRYETPTEVAQGVGRDEYWSATVSGSVCGVALPENPVTFASVQKSHWTNVVRTPKP
jgi:hypothetical protein